MTTPDTITIRRADASDRSALERLAALDSGRTPSGEILLATVGGDVRAAIGITSREYIADPFAPTRDVVALLDRRAARMRAEDLPWPARARARLALWSGMWLRAAEAGRLR